MLDQVALLLLRETESQEPVVVVHDIPKRREASVVIEAALLVCPQTAERRRAVRVGRRTIRLERVHADLRGRVEVVAGLRVEWRDVAGRAARLALEEGPAAFEGSCVEGPRGRLRRGDRELVEVQGGQLGGDLVGRAARVPR